MVLGLSLALAACGSSGSLPGPGVTPGEEGASTQATGIGAQANARPAWSPNDRWIAWETSRDGSREIFIMDADGTNPRNCTRSGARDQYPVWSPDGTKILFESNRSGNDDLFAVAFDKSTDECAGSAVNLTKTGAHERPGDWGPNGLIAFSTERDGNLEVYLMNEDGSNQRNCSRTKFSDHTAAFSPNGSELAIHSHRYLTPKTNNGEIWIIPISNGQCGTAWRLTTNDYIDESPDYNPRAGSQLVVHRNMLKAGTTGTDNYDLFIIDRNSRAESHLTSGAANDLHPNWSPDGMKIAFNSDRGGRYDIWVVNVDGSGLVNLTGK